MLNIDLNRSCKIVVSYGLSAYDKVWYVSSLLCTSNILYIPYLPLYITVSNQACVEDTEKAEMRDLRQLRMMRKNSSSHARNFPAKKTMLSVILDVSNELDGSLERFAEKRRSLGDEVSVRSIIYKSMSDEKIVQLINNGVLSHYKLEKTLEDDLRAVKIRRKWLSTKLRDSQALDCLPYDNYDYSRVTNTCCENVIGYVPTPVAFIGPLPIDDNYACLPLATFNSAQIDQLNVACAAISACGGIQTVLIDDYMTRGPVVEFDSITESLKFKRWLERPCYFQMVKQTFDSTSSFAKLKRVETRLADRAVYMRFYSLTGDAMGMNMVSKAAEAVLDMLAKKYFTSMRVVALSGNYCVDKKPAAINWIQGRGKQMIAEATVSASVVEKVLKTSVPAMVHLHTTKNFLGSAMAGVIGGYNSSAADIVASLFLATGQDVAQTVSSSQCLTVVETTTDGHLRISCSMPSLEVGTVGGGTNLLPQRAMLRLLGCAGGNNGMNAQELASAVCAAVLVGELSSLAVECTQELVAKNLRIPVATMSSSFSENIDGNGKITKPRPLETIPSDSDEDYNENEYENFSDDELILLLNKEPFQASQLETILSNPDRAISVRRQWLEERLDLGNDLNSLPFLNLQKLVGQKHRIPKTVIGYIPVPVGYAGPVTIDNVSYHIPMATTEGALVASANRGCSALRASGGVSTFLIDDFSTSAPVVEFDDIRTSLKLKQWLEDPKNFHSIRQTFDDSKNLIELKHVDVKLCDRSAHLRFVYTTGDTLCSQAADESVESVLRLLSENANFPRMRIISFRGNYDAEKKAAAVNWIHGRGKQVIGEAIIPVDIVKKVLKTTVESIVHLHVSKNVIGSALAGALGGFNAHAANIITALFIATGQDVARNVTSSQCMTTLEATAEGDLRISCTMPCIEVGTTGGATECPGQKSCLQMLGCAGPNVETPGANAALLARIVCAATIAGELSLLAALSTSDLVKSHMKHNRAPVPKVFHTRRLSHFVLGTQKMVSAAQLHPETCSKVLT